MKLFQPEAFLARPENKFLDPKYLDASDVGKNTIKLVAGLGKVFVR